MLTWQQRKNKERLSRWLRNLADTDIDQLDRNARFQRGIRFINGLRERPFIVEGWKRERR